MSLRIGRRDEKVLPPLPAQHQDAQYNTFDDTRVKESESGTWAAFLSESPTKEGRSQSKGKGKAPPPLPIPIPLPSLSTDFTPRHSPSSPAKSTSTPTSTRHRFASASTSNLNQFDGPSSPHSYRNRYHPGGSQFDFAPPSPSIASQRSLANSTSTAKAGGKRSMFNPNTKTSSKSAPSFRSSQTMPEMIAYNDVDQWGVGAGAGPQSPRSPKKDKAFNQSSEGVRRKGSSSKMLAKGLSRGLTRMGSVMKRSTSSAKMGVGEGDENRRRRVNRHSIVREEMGEEWERVDIQKEVTEGDTSITRPFNVEHSLHVSPDLDNLPPAWLQALKDQGLSEEDLLLIAAARQKAGQRPMLRIVKGSLPPSDEVSIPTPFSQARARGLSTPAPLIISNSNHHSSGEAEKPVLDKRFSWARSPTTPTGTPNLGEVESPHTPLRAFRQSLQKPQSPTPAANQRLTRTPLGGFISNRDIQEENGESGTEETPKKTKRWSDQLRGFQSSFAGLGGDDNWGDSLTSALALDGGMLQTVHESNHSRRESESGDLVTESHEVEEEQRPEPPPKTTVNAQLVSPRIDSSSTIRTGPTSPTSPTTREARIRRKPVPSIVSPPVSPSIRRHSDRTTVSQARSKSPTSPKIAAKGDRPTYPRSNHSRTRSAGLSQSISQSNDSDLDHDLRTPSTNENFPLSTSRSADPVLPPLPRSISEESHWATYMTKPTEHAEQWLHFTPPRPDPRLSLPATARYTESSPPSRSHTPEIEYSEASHYLPSEMADHHSSLHETQIQAQVSIPKSVTTPSPRSPTSPRPRRDKDPLSRIDNAPRSERASIALSMLSDPRSSLGSIKSSYPHEARIMKAFTREPGEGLGGLRESDGERDSSDQASGDSHDHDQRDIGRLENAAIITSDGDERRRYDDSPRTANSNSATRNTKHSKSGSHRSKSSSGSSSSGTRSRRSNEREVSTYSPHPFAYQPEADASSVHETEDDALSALDDAAREIARQRGRVASVSSGKKMEGRYEDASVQV